MFSGSRDRSGSTFSSYKGTNPIRLGAYPYDLIFSFLTSLEALSPNTVTWGFRASAYKFWGHIQSIIQTKKKKTHLNESSYRIFSCTCTNGKILKTILANKISYIYIWLNIMYLYIKICMCVCVGASQVVLVIGRLDLRDIGSIPGLRRSPGGGHGNPLQYSCLKNMDRGAW